MANLVVHVDQQADYNITFVAKLSRTGLQPDEVFDK